MISLLFYLLLVSPVRPGSTDSLFVPSLTRREDGHTHQCTGSIYYTKFVETRLNHYSQFFDKWSPDFIDNLTSTYENPFYYDRIQLLDNSVNYERGDFWREDYDPTRQFPEKYYAQTLNNVLDYIHWLLDRYNIKLPNIDFLVLGSEYYYDYPTYMKIDYPIFRFENSNNDWGIWSWLLPSREYVQYWNIFTWDWTYEVVVDNTTIPHSLRPRTEWKDRKDRALFRGSVYKPYEIRYKMLEMMVKHGDDAQKYLDVKMKPHDDMMGDKMINKHKDILIPTQGMPDKEQMEYKFIIAADGSCSPDRVARQLLYGSVMFKQVSKYKSQYFFDLIPYKHFIPWSTAEDLYNKVKFYSDKISIDNPNKEERELMIKYLTNIGLYGMKYVLENFNSEYMDCHAVNMLHLYSNTFKNANINKVTLEKKKKKDEEQREWFHERSMNKSVVFNEESKYRSWLMWPVETADKALVEQVEKQMDFNGLTKEVLERFNYDKATRLLKRNRIENIGSEYDNHGEEGQRQKMKTMMNTLQWGSNIRIRRG